MASPSYDDIVIGAGAAGLIAAGELLRAGRSVLLLEARGRIGGRIWTRREPGFPTPIELGAEFIHGPAPTTRALLAKAGIAAIESSDSHLTLANGELAPRDHFFAKIQQALRSTDVLSGRDMSFDAFLEQHLAQRLSSEERQYARMLAEGFDAADTSRASARALADEWTGATLGEVPQSRPQNGYEALLAALVAELKPERLRLQLHSPVHTVHWSRGAVEVAGEFIGAPFQARGERAILALPLGVMQRPPGTAGAVRFSPALEAKREALGALASGPIVKMLLRFASSFWDSVHNGRFRDVSFLHAPGAPIPTFWTPAPVEAPLLVAWAGGPTALRLADGASPAQIARKAVEILQKLFGKGVDVGSQLQGYYYHDWQQDPFACGAYSYVTVGGGAARQALGQPIEDTLFFAGEATDTDDEAGTVAGALQSGIRAAHEALGAS
jgi:monoamine oxidase